MKRNILVVFAFLAFTSTFGQFNESAPWMNSLDKKRGQSTKKSNQSYTIYEISKAFEDYWKDKDPTVKGSGYKPFKRWENYWIQSVKSNGQLPTAENLLQALKNKKDRTGKIINPTAQWTAIGPFNPGTLGGSLPGTGRINAIAVDPNNPDIWFAGAAAGGIWKSEDAGASWTNLFDDFLQIGVSGIAIDPNNSDVIYIATGDDDAGDSFSVGVFKSTDAGLSWTETGLGPSTVNNWGNNRLMSEITIDPTNSNIIWVATSFGIYRSLDAGATWDRKQSGNIKDFRLKPGDPSTVYAITPSQYYKSTDGENFTRITDILPATSGRLVLDVTPADPNVLYILSAKTGANDFEYQGLYKSIDSGTTFVESPNSVDIMESNQAWFDLALVVAPDNANEIYMGCLNIWRSSNGGNTFNRVNRWNINNLAYTHADIHTLKFFGEKLFAATDGGLYVSENSGASFEDKTNNMAISQFYRISVAKNNKDRIVGGTQDNSGFVSNGTDWNIFTGGDGMDYEIDPNNENLIYGFAQLGSPLFITTDSGQSIGFVNAPEDEEGNALVGNWITPLAVNSNGDVFAGYDAVYKLEGGSWVKWSNDFGNGNIDDIEIDPTNPDILYAAESDFVYRSEDGGVTFTAFNRFDSNISDISVNQTDGSTIYVTTSSRIGTSESQQQEDKGVFKVPVNANGNAGPEVDITFNLPQDQSFFAIKHQGRHTENPIYVATTLGVYRLDDTLTEWEEYFTDLPSTAVSDLEITLDAETITASTYGRGVWQSPISVQVPDTDIQLVNISPSNNNVLCTEIIPEITVENKGLNAVSTIDISYEINGGASQNFEWTGLLESNETTIITLPALTNTNKGINTLNAAATTPNDAFAENNEKIGIFTVNTFGLGDDLVDFESEVSSLITYNDTDDGSVWQRGVPSGTLLNTASSGSQVLGTNLDGNHPDGTKGFIVSGCYELSSILAPVLKFDMAYDLELNFDIVYVQYSTDEGNNWNLLGNIDSEPNWYNSDRTNASSNGEDCENCPGGQWTGTNATLTSYSYDFTTNASRGEVDLTQEDNIIFRIVFQSDPNLNQEGVIIDDFIVEGVQDDDDDDNDGILDVNDNCPLQGNADQADNDSDGIGDICDPDDDNDGILDVDDNCPLTANPGQEDEDQDGIGNICDNDTDNDGVPNANDLCDNTPVGAIVDATGCEIFSLPANNFSVRVIGESCATSNNGTINITSLIALNYTATLTDENTSSALEFTEATSFQDLAAGNYEICITIAEQEDYIRCFDITLQEPEALGVSSKINSLKNEVSLSLSGGKRYIIVLNDQTFETAQDTITLPLDKIENELMVKTDVDCQGIFEETIRLSNNLIIYPNPITQGNLNIIIGENTSDNIEVSMFTVTGRQVFKKKFEARNSTSFSYNIDEFNSGIYILNVRTAASLMTYKIIKK